jgi:hypothetical protein
MKIVKSNGIKARIIQGKKVSHPRKSTSFSRVLKNGGILHQGFADQRRRDAQDAKTPEVKKGFMSELKLRPPKEPTFSATC